MKQTQTESPYPPGYCEQGSIVNLGVADWTHIAREDRARAQRSDARRIQAERRQQLHRACCTRCGGEFP